MKIIVISDTHGLHDQLSLPKGDMLLHTGDVSKHGKKQDVAVFLDWFRQQEYEYKIFIAGNHDFFFERYPAEAIEALIPQNIIYLNDSGVEINGIKIWGSPVQPRFFDWAFNRDRGADIDQHWQLIPAATDILITHGPPHGILDKTYTKLEVGCKMLLNKVKEIQPQYHIFGHIHEAYGQVRKNNIQFINASVVNLRYQVVNSPVELEI